MKAWHFALIYHKNNVHMLAEQANGVRRSVEEMYCCCYWSLNDVDNDIDRKSCGVQTNCIRRRRFTAPTRMEIERTLFNIHRNVRTYVVHTIELILQWVLRSHFRIRKYLKWPRRHVDKEVSTNIGNHCFDMIMELL